jgi:hypothetical protein
MYFQSLDPGFSQCPFATDCSPVSRILVAKHGACSKKYRHDGSRCTQEFVRGRHVAFRSVHRKEVETRSLLLRLYPAFTSISGSLFSLLLRAMLYCSSKTPFFMRKLHIILARFAEHCRLGHPMAWNHRVSDATLLRPSVRPGYSLSISLLLFIGA